MFHEAEWEDNDACNSTFAYVEIDDYGFVSINANVEEGNTHINLAYYPYEMDEDNPEPEFEVEIVSTFNHKRQKPEILKLAENVFRAKVLPIHQQKSVAVMKRLAKIQWKDAVFNRDENGNITSINYQYHDAPQTVKIEGTALAFYDGDKIYRRVPLESVEECQTVLNYIFTKPQQEKEQ